MREGIVTVPSSAIVTRASPFAELFQTMTAVAPAAIAFLALTRNVQVPRWTKAILPATAAALVNPVQPLAGMDATRSPVNGFVAAISGDEPEACVRPAMEAGEFTLRAP